MAKKWLVPSYGIAWRITNFTVFGSAQYSREIVYGYHFVPKIIVNVYRIEFQPPIFFSIVYVQLQNNFEKGNQLFQTLSIFVNIITGLIRT